MPQPKAKFLLPGRCWSIRRTRSKNECSRANAAPSSVEGMEPAGAALVFLFALLTAVATGLGAVPFAFAKRPTRRWLGASNAVAAGLMLAASFGLIYEGMHYGPLRALVGALLGLVFIVAARRALRQDEHPAVFASMSGLDARKALLIVGVMTIHSFTEGVGIGVSFGGGQALGLFISLALAVHNIPEGLAISLVLVPRGVGWVRAAFWSIFSSLPQPLMARSEEHTSELQSPDHLVCRL